MKAKLFMLFICLSHTLLAQKQSISLLKTIDLLSEKHEVVFSYNPTLLQGVLIPQKKLDQNLRTALNQLTTLSAFTFEQIDAKNVLVKAKQAGKNFRLCLQVLDASSKEAMAGAVVYDQQKKEGFTVNAQGEGSLYIHLADWDVVFIDFLGYKTQEVPIKLFNGQANCYTVLLEQETQALNEVEIIAYLHSGLNYRHKDQSVRLSPDDAALLPGETETDVLMTLDALPGINSPDGKAGNLILRGDDPDKTLLTFDDIPIYHQGHYFGTFSPFNVNVIDEMIIHRTGYSADKGGRVGGAVEIRSKSAIPKKIDSGIGLATSYLSGFTHIPVVKNKLSILLAGRSNYPFNWDSPKIKAIHTLIYSQSDIDRIIKDDVPVLQFGYRFNDINVKANYQINAKHLLNTSFLNIFTALDAEAIFRDQGYRGYDGGKLHNWGISSVLTSKWSDRFSSKLSVIHSRYNQRFLSKNYALRSRREISRSDYNNTIDDFSIKAVTQLKLDDHKTVELGYQWHHHNIDFLTLDASDTTAQLLRRRQRTGNVNSIFTSFTINKPDQLDLALGVRFSHYDLTNKVYVEPRIQFNYYLNEHLTLKANTGLYNQYINHIAATSSSTIKGLPILNWQISDGTDIPVVNSRQIMLGAILEKGDWVVDLESYVKNTRDISIDNYNQRSSNEFIYGGYETIGFDLMVKRSWTHFNTWVGYTLSQTLLDVDSISINKFRSIWDQSHLFNWVGNYQTGKWSFSVGWKLKSGLAILDGIRDRYLLGDSNNSTNSGGGNPGNPPGGGGGLPRTDISSSFPTHHQLDVSASYKLGNTNSKVKGNIGLSMINVYDNRIALRNVLITDTTVRGLGFAPSLMLNLRF